MTLKKMAFPTFSSLSSWKRKFEIPRNAESNHGFTEEWRFRSFSVISVFIWDSEKEEPCELVLVWTATQNTQWEQVHRCANSSSSWTLGGKLEKTQCKNVVNSRTRKTQRGNCFLKVPPTCYEETELGSPNELSPARVPQVKCRDFLSARSMWLFRLEMKTCAWGRSHPCIIEAPKGKIPRQNSCHLIKREEGKGTT